MTIRAFMWTEFMVRTRRDNIPHIICESIKKILQAYDLHGNYQIVLDSYVEYKFSGIDERTRLEIQKKVIALFDDMQFIPAYTKHDDVCIRWVGAETRIYEAMALNEYVQ